MGQAYPTGGSSWRRPLPDRGGPYHVKLGENYIVGQTTYSRWLPLAWV